MKRSKRLARHYIRAVDLCAVYLTSTKGRVRIGMTRDPAARVRTMKRARARLHCVYWLGSSDAATKLVHAVCVAFPGIDRGADVRPAAVVDALAKIAREAGLSVTEDSVVQARAAAVVRDTDQRVAAMQASGQLRGLNAEYRAARAEAVKLGDAIRSYGDYLERYKIKMLYEVAGVMRAR